MYEIYCYFLNNRFMDVLSYFCFVSKAKVYYTCEENAWLLRKKISSRTCWPVGQQISITYYLLFLSLFKIQFTKLSLANNKEWNQSGKICVSEKVNFILQTDTKSPTRIKTAY